MSQIEEKVGKLRDVYLGEDNEKMISDMEKALRTKIAAAKLQERAEVKAIIGDGIKRMKDINFLLAYDRTLTDVQREGLFKERIVHQFWLDRFGAKNVEQFIKSLDEYVDEKMKA